MDPNDDNSLFNFINTLTNMQLDKDELNEKDGKLLNSNLPSSFGSSAGGGGGSVGSFPTDFSLLKKDFKPLNVCDQTELGSTGHSDKSLSSFGSESNDSNGESNSGPSESILPSLIGFIGSVQSNDSSNGPTLRESSQSPAFFGFSSSNSSSPPLSQTSGPSSASSLSEAVSTLANGTIPASANNNNHTFANSDFSFNSLSNPTKQSSGPSFASNSKNDNSSFFTNPLDSMFSTMLSNHGGNNGSRTGDSIGDSFSALLDNSAFVPADTSTLEQRRFPSQANQPGILPTSFSQDSLPHFFQNSFSPFSPNVPDNDIMPSGGTGTGGAGLQNNRKFSLFNGNHSNSNNSMTSCTTTLSSPIISTPLFSSSNFLFNESLDQRACNLMSSSLVNSNANMQARFESHIRSIANEINSTVQLYTSSLQMRREQLLKQLDHVRNTYLLLLAQNKGKLSNPIPFPRITFSRPDSTLFKLVTSFGFLNSPAFAPYCNVTGEGLSVAVEGEPTCFSIATKNCFNEEMLTGGENIDVEIQAIETNAHHNGSFMPMLTHIQKNVLDNNNGKYNVTYMIPRGSNLRNVKIFININGLPVSNSPFLATIKTERLRENWKRISLYGEEGAELGKFCRPWGVAMVRLPIQKDPNHKPIGGDSTQTIPMQSKAFYNWNCNSANKKDYLLTVADRSNNRIQLLKLSVADLSGSNTPNEGIFSNNFALNNNVDVSVLHTFGSGPGTRNGQFDRPAGIAINSNFGQIVVVDKDNHRIQVFDLTGNFLFKFGEKGSRAGQFCYPWDVAICPQTSLILVSDTRNRRIQLFTHFGQYLWHCGQPLDSPRGVAFLSPERYIVSDFNKHRLLIIDKNDTSLHNNLASNNRDDLINSKYIGFGEGSAWGEFLRPQGLVASINKNFTTGASKFVQILCADSRNNRIAIWNSLNQNFEYINDDNSKSDSISNVAASFDRPSGIAMADNILAVVDFGNNRLQIFQRCSQAA